MLNEKTRCRVFSFIYINKEKAKPKSNKCQQMSGIKKVAKKS